MLSILFTLAVFVNALFIYDNSFNILETLIILKVWHGCMDGCGVTKLAIIQQLFCQLNLYVTFGLCSAALAPTLFISSFYSLESISHFC